MISNKRIGLVAAFAVMATMAFGASAAHAAVDKATCQFDGVAGIASPGVQSVATDAAPENGGPATVATDFDAGSYEFGSTTADEATCVRLDSDAGEQANNGTYTVDIVSQGQYNNRVCGTGTAEDTAPSNTSLSGAPGLQGPVTPTYHIDFTSGVGPLQITGGSWDGGTLRGAGEVAIVPNDTDGDPNTHPCVDEDVAEFTVAGTFKALAVSGN